MILTDGAVVLYPSDNREYISHLLRTHPLNLMNDRGIARYVKSVRYLWVGEAAGSVVGGVLYFCFFPGIGWTFDAYSERKKLKALDNKGAWAYKASCLVLDWFRRNIGGTLHAFVDEENHGAIFMAKKLGFKKQENKNGMVVLRKEF